MRFRLVIAIILSVALAGCATAPAARGSRLLPWNWFASDSTAKVEQAQARGDAADDKLRREAQRMAQATKLAIDEEKARQLAVGGVSRELTTAAEYAGRTVALLNASEGFLAFDVQRELAEMVRQRNSAVEAERARGDKLLTAADRIAENAATLKVKSEQALAAAQKQVGAEQQRALVAEEKYHRVWFCIWCALGGIALLKVLPLLAGAFPALAPIARVASWVVAPTVQAGYSKLRATVGGLIASAEKAGNLTAEAIRAHLDGPITESEQSELHRHYTAAKLP